MADYLVTDTELTSIADAIRTKGGTSADLSFPTGFVSAIEAIASGNAHLCSGSLTINASGVQTIQTGYTGSKDIVALFIDMTDASRSAVSSEVIQKGILHYIVAKKYLGETPDYSTTIAGNKGYYAFCYKSSDKYASSTAITGNTDATGSYTHYNIEASQYVPLRIVSKTEIQIFIWQSNTTYGFIPNRQYNWFAVYA